MESEIFAGIVLYNPDINRLKENIDAIYEQVKMVVLFDNGSNNYKDIIAIKEQYNDIHIIFSDKNVGIAEALNRLMQFGLNKKIKWMLSLDQDSVCESKYVKKMEGYLDIEPKLGIVAPVIRDRNVGIVGHNPVKKYQHVNTCITSGAFTNIKAWKQIGGFDKKMFIDSVDFEFCFRMRKNGFGVIQVRDVILLHEIGKSEKKRFLFWHITVNGHNAFRKFYIAQNNIYYPLKHHLWIRFIRGNIRNLILIYTILLYENSKKEKIQAVLRGWKMGYKLRKA